MDETEFSSTAKIRTNAVSQVRKNFPALLKLEFIYVRKTFLITPRLSKSHSDGFSTEYSIFKVNSMGSMIPKKINRNMSESFAGNFKSCKDKEIKNTIVINDLLFFLFLLLLFG